MKVLFFIHGLSAGGAERVLSLLANDWNRLGHDITIAMYKTEHIFHHIDDSINILNIGIKQEGIAKEIIGNYRRIKNIKNTINNVNPDIVISFMTATSILTNIAAKLANKPIINSEHTNFFALKSKLWRLLRRIIYPFSNALIVLTSHDKEKYQFHSNVQIIENPLKLTHNHNKIQRENIIMAVGRLIKLKGFDMLLEAFANLKRTDDWKLIILGEGSERVNLEQQAKELNISEQVKFLGVVSDVEKYYKKASIFVLSSRWEGFPVALCEAMSYGCPPVAFNCLTGPSDIIDDAKNGLLVEPENIKALSNSIQNLIDSPQKRNHLSKNAIKIEERLNINRISRQWFEVIEKVLQAK